MKLTPLVTLAFSAALLAQQTLAPPAFRLGDAVRPVRYFAELTVVPEKDTFSGSIEIGLDVRTPTAVIWMNAVDLTFDQASLIAGAQTLPAKVVTAGDAFAGFVFTSPVPAGKAALRVTWHGKLNAQSSAGLFKNKVGGDWYAFTQFESIDARHVFPCFDEPGFKVPWQLTLHVKREHMALSNTPVLSQTDEPNGMKKVAFAPTRPLPSYLVALAVGPFEAVDAGTAGVNKVPLRIITPRGMTAQAKYAAQVSGQILTALENYFGIPYPYPKLDEVAVPLFFGAMENAGLITYGQTIILAAPAEDTINRQRGFAETAAHEMAHMWFGDLVTTAWWDDIWLNEAFATWMEEKIVQQWKPAWGIDVSSAEGRQYAMDTDSLVSARKIRQPILSRDDIANAFDNITYGKGAAVIYMFEQWIGPDVFRRGVQAYLKKHADGNATAADFLASIGAAAKRDIAPVFSTFLDQAGVPLLTAELKCSPGRPPAIALTEQRYLPLGSKAPGAQVWQIPVCLRTDAAPKAAQCTLFTAPSGEIAIKGAAACPAWVDLNAGEAGYYRTLYRGGLLTRLVAGAGKPLTPEERIGIVGDADALFRGGQLQAGEVLRLVPEFANDPTRQVVSMTAGVVAGLNSHLVPDGLRPDYERFVEAIFGARARQFGWISEPGESDDVRLLRSSIVPMVANEGEDKVLVAEAATLARRWLDDHTAVPMESIGGIMHTAARHGGRTLYDRIAAELAKTTDERQRGILIEGMSAFRDPAIIKQNFDLLLEKKIDVREALSFLIAPLDDPRARAIPFDLVRANYDRLVQVLPHAVDQDYSAYLPLVGRAFCDRQHRNEVAGFFKERIGKASGGPRILAQTLESVDQCIAVTSAQQSGVTEFLKKY